MDRRSVAVRRVYGSGGGVDGIDVLFVIWARAADSQRHASGSEQRVSRWRHSGMLSGTGALEFFSP